MLFLETSGSDLKIWKGDCLEKIQYLGSFLSYGCFVGLVRKGGRESFGIFDFFNMFLNFCRRVVGATGGGNPTDRLFPDFHGYFFFYGYFFFLQKKYLRRPLSNPNPQRTQEKISPFGVNPSL